ncbi:MAG: N-acetylglutaminylglutamine synthetase, partial [Burkholderiales bacterium]|nr:N-acetylglutaminylglutamine synthetase [Burkholderiales bacterium]
MSICDDKRVTRRIVKAADVTVPSQVYANNDDDARAFLKEHSAIVVKPARGEQGKGVSVDLRNWRDTKRAIATA